MTIRIEVSTESLGYEIATAANVEDYCTWADDWFGENYPDLDVEHVPGPGGSRGTDVYEAEQECFEAWCAAGAQG